MKIKQKLFQNLLRVLRDLDFKNQEKKIVCIAILLSNFRFEIPRKIRMLLVTLLPRNPLELDKKSIIDVIIPLTQKDFLIVKYSIYGLLLNSQNHINQITLCIPEVHTLEFKKNYKKQINSLVSLLGTTKIKIISDEEVLGKIKSNIYSLGMGNRTGWIIQQIIKIKSAMNSSVGSCLVLDADTVFLKPITFVNGYGKQVLHVGTDRHTPYLVTLQKVWGFRPENFKLSFVTHFQLMQKKYLFDMYGDDSMGIFEIVSAGDRNESSMFSEYETYGKYMSMKQRDKITYVRWDNVPADRNILCRMKHEDYQNNYNMIKKLYNSFGSISFHSYLN
jgi:Family of unknown function (DUF6492)